MLVDMGNREALLEGAKRCLLEKGYARTTARDIAEAAGVSLAAIGYHYGSKESLLEQAFMAAMGDWFADGDELRDPSGHRRAAQERPGAQGQPLRPGGSLEEFRDFFGGIIASFPDQRPLLRLNLEMGIEGADHPELGAFMAAAIQEGREGLAEILAGLEPERDGELAQQVGAFYSVVMTGLVGQYLMDRERFPSASDVTEGLRYIAQRALKA